MLLINGTEDRKRLEGTWLKPDRKNGKVTILSLDDVAGFSPDSPIDCRMGIKAGLLSEAKDRLTRLKGWFETGPVRERLDRFVFAPDVKANVSDALFDFLVVYLMAAVADEKSFGVESAYRWLEKKNPQLAYGLMGLVGYRFANESKNLAFLPSLYGLDKELGETLRPDFFCLLSRHPLTPVFSKMASPLDPMRFALAFAYVSDAYGNPRAESESLLASRFKNGRAIYLSRLRPLSVDAAGNPILDVPENQLDLDGFYRWAKTTEFVGIKTPKDLICFREEFQKMGLVVPSGGKLAFTVLGRALGASFDSRMFDELRRS